MTFIVSAEAISHRYADLEAIQGVSLTVAAGEVVSLLGPSGCGKTTMLRLVAGLERLQTGTIRLDGAVVADAARSIPPEQRAIGMVFQDYALFPHLNVADNVRFGLRRLEDGEQRRRVADALERVDMLAHAENFPHQLSGGQQQRVALARALAPQPRLMLMDEPFSGLDARLRDVVRERTLRILQEAGAAVLMVTHDPEEAMFMSGRIALMRSGRLIQFDRPETLYFRPADNFAARFFGETNLLPVQVAGREAMTPFGTLPLPDDLTGMLPLTLMVRPEGLDIVAADQARATGRVHNVRFLGANRLVHVELDGTDLQVLVRIAAHLAPAPGERIGLLLRHEYAAILPADR